MAKTSRSSLADRVFTRRTAAGMSQQALAHTAGLSLSVIAQIEQGKKTDPRLSTVQAIAATLDIDLTDLVGPPSAGPNSVTAIAAATGSYYPPNGKPPPLPLRAGRVLVHDDVRHTANFTQGRKGFRFWLQDPAHPRAPQLVVCGCGYAPKHAIHYIVDREADRSVGPPPRPTARPRRSPAKKGRRRKK